jgi:prepilin-type N-terminal cleavage/methylation domain-containing protein
MGADRMSTRRRRARPGFTLLEVIVAMAVGSLVVLGARAMLVMVADGGDAAREAAIEADRAANAEAVLRRLLADLELGTDPAMHFSGAPDEARFSTWCPVAGGWIERCRATLAIEATRDGAALVATLSAGGGSPDERLELRSGLDRAELLYLSDAARGGRWFRVWGEGITAPLAVGLVVDSAGRTDTTILRIGERG